MRATLSEVKLFIVDEISMVSSINLAFVHMRLEELFELFGSRNMLFVGDLLQHPPVHGNPVFDKVATILSILSQLRCAAAINVWRDCVTDDELTINKHQKNDPQFSSMLDCVETWLSNQGNCECVETEGQADKFSELQQSGKSLCDKRGLTRVEISHAYSQKSSVAISWISTEISEKVEIRNQLPCGHCFSTPYSSVHYYKTGPAASHASRDIRLAGRTSHSYQAGSAQKKGPYSSLFLTSQH